MEIKVIELEANGGLAGLLAMLAEGPDGFKRAALKNVDKAASDSADMMVACIMYPDMSDEDKAHLYADPDDLIANREELEARMEAMRNSPRKDVAVWLEDDAVCFHDLREADGVLRKPFPTCQKHGDPLRTMAQRYVDRIGPYWAAYIPASLYAMSPEATDLTPDELKPRVAAIYAERGLKPMDNMDLNVAEFYD